MWPTVIQGKQGRIARENDSSHQMWNRRTDAENNMEIFIYSLNNSKQK